MRTLVRGVVVGAFALLCASLSSAQITLTAPTGAISVTEGDDFFTTVMNEPVDFDQRRDFMWEEGFSEPTIGVSGGVWSGSFAQEGGYVFPLFPGFGGNSGAMNTGRTGERFPVDATKYRYLAYKRRVSDRTNQNVYVGQDVAWPTIEGLVCAGRDGYQVSNGGPFVEFPTDRYTIDLYDFRQTNPNPTRCDSAISKSTPWTGQIRALRIDPSEAAGAGTTAEFDWVRLVDPSSAPTIAINWTTLAGNDVNIYVDNDSSGNDGAFIGRVSATGVTGSFMFPSAALPPGTWYFYVELRASGSDVLLVRSAYSGALTVNGRTRVRIDDPSMTSGPDYATEWLGNPWDFNDSSDIANFADSSRQFKNASFSGGVFTATAFAPVFPATESDVQVRLNTGNRPIPTWRYRYLNYTTSIDGTRYGNISDKVANGHITRAIWWTRGLSLDGSESKGNITYEGMHTYAVDLANDAQVLSRDDPFAAQKGWLGIPSVSNFRLDPGEFTQYETQFRIDDVKLRARSEPDSSNNFTVKLTTFDPEGNTATIQVFRDTDSAGYDGTLVGTLSDRSPGAQTLQFSTASLFPQELWIYVVVTDTAGNVTRRYSEAPLRVGPQQWQPFFAVHPLETPYVGDFNGDGRTDIITFTRQNPAAFGDVYVALSNGSQFVDKSGTVGSSDKWHDWFAISTSEQVVIGDYDGDNRDDIATWLSTTTRQVYVALSQGTGMGQESVWVDSIGVTSSDVLMSGDANGDGRQDLILFARTQGKVYVALSDGAKFGTPTVWHNFFAVSTYERPRVADVTGDGRADIVTFATDSPTAFGDVYVSVSNGSRFVDLDGGTDSSSKWHDFFATRPTEEVRIGDLDKDGKDDFFTFLPAPFGQAYTVKSLGSSMADNVLWMPDGLVYLDTDKPFTGDVNADGKADIILFRQVPGKVEVVITP